MPCSRTQHGLTRVGLEPPTDIMQPNATVSISIEPYATFSVEQKEQIEAYTLCVSCFDEILSSCGCFLCACTLHASFCDVTLSRG